MDRELVIKEKAGEKFRYLLFARRHSLCLSPHATRFHFRSLLLCFELLFLSKFHLLFCFDLIHTVFNSSVGLVEVLILLGFGWMLFLVLCPGMCFEFFVFQ